MRTSVKRMRGVVKAILRAGERRLGPRALEILDKMWDHENEADGELVSEGREVWLGLERTSLPVVYALLRACAIKDVSDSRHDGMRRYVINETGREVLERWRVTDAR